MRNVQTKIEDTCTDLPKVYFKMKYSVFVSEISKFKIFPINIDEVFLKTIRFFNLFTQNHILTFAEDTLVRFALLLFRPQKKKFY